MAFSSAKLIIFSCVALAVLNSVTAADPDPVADFTVPGKANEEVTYADFLFNKQEAKDVLFQRKAVFTAFSANKLTLPVLGDQGISLTLLNFPPGTQNSPHEHPRATEILLVLKGELTVGLADTTPKNQNGPLFFENIVKAGEAVVFPRGLAHFQINKGRQPVIAVAALNSANPGTLRLQEALDAFKPVLAGYYP